jgi:hypothetical protein
MDRIHLSDRPAPRHTGLALLLGALLTGCGSGQEEVSGTVRYKGKPLPFGTIQFLGSDGVLRAGAIQPDGTFAVQVPVGEAKVIISCLKDTGPNRPRGASASRDGRAAPPPSSSANVSLIPRRYTDWDASGLTVLVGDGQTVRDFDLVPN